MRLHRGIHSAWMRTTGPDLEHRGGEGKGGKKNHRIPVISGEIATLEPVVSYHTPANTNLHRAWAATPSLHLQEQQAWTARPCRVRSAQFPGLVLPSRETDAKRLQLHVYLHSPAGRVQDRNCFLDVRPIASDR